jgi:ribonucleotide reductase alpha subunit
MRGNKIGFTREQIKEYGLKQGSLLEIGGNASVSLLIDSGIESIFKKAYKEKFDREYA